jgi:Cu/Ag efflux protein CusF
MKRINWRIAIMGALLASSCSTMRSKPETPAPPAAQPGAPVVSGTVGEQTVKLTAKVKKVDLKTRHVTLEDPDGKLVTVKAGDEVRNLAQLKVGDNVVVKYYESLAYEVKKPGDATPGIAVAAGAQRAKLGEKPGGGVARVTTITTTITGIDKTNGTVTLTGPDGEPTTVKARNPANLDKVKIGDLVEITYTESLAIAVDPATN